MRATAPLRDAGRTRALLLDAAERIFEREGWHCATLSAIGAEAGVSRGTPGYFFASKAGLHAAMCQRLVDAARAAATIDLAGDPRDRAIALLQSQLLVAARRPALARLAVEHWTGGLGRAAAEVVSGFAALERDLIRQIRELIESVPGRSGEPETGRAAAGLLSLTWSAALPSAPGGSTAHGAAALTDQTELIAVLVRKLFNDTASTHDRDRAEEAPTGSLTFSKSRNWRLPGVG